MSNKIAMSPIMICHEKNNLSRILKCCDIDDSIHDEICIACEKRLEKANSSKISETEISDRIIETIFGIVSKYPSKFNTHTLKFIVEAYDKDWNLYKNI